MEDFKLKKFVEENGVENCYFLIGMQPVRQILFVKYTSSSDEHFSILCKISEEKYKVEDGYKVTLVPAQDLGTEFETRDFYQMDLEAIIRKGNAQLFVKKDI